MNTRRTRSGNRKSIVWASLMLGPTLLLASGCSPSETATAPTPPPTATATAAPSTPPKVEEPQTKKKMKGLAPGGDLGLRERRELKKKGLLPK
jgi:hypothetical protein